MNETPSEMQVVTKSCSTCKETKPLTDFGFAKQSKDGHNYQCKKCRIISVAASHAKHPQTQATSQFRYTLSPAGRGVRLYIGMARRSTAKGTAFDITPEWITQRILKGTCEVTGIPFDLAVDPRGSGYKNSFGPSLDQTVPGKGYTQDNTKLVVWAYNGAKGTGSHEDVMKLAKAMCHVQ